MQASARHERKWIERAPLVINIVINIVIAIGIAIVIANCLVWNELFLNNIN